jgi:hypothetical protein
MEYKKTPFSEKNVGLSRQKHARATKCAVALVLPGLPRLRINRRTEKPLTPTES